MSTVSMSGSFRMAANGPGGTVKWTWVYKDTLNGKTVVTTHSGSLVVAAGDTSAHFISDSYVHPNSSGSAYVIFTSPSYASLSLTQTWTCR